MYNQCSRLVCPTLELIALDSVINLVMMWHIEHVDHQRLVIWRLLNAEIVAVGVLLLLLLLQYVLVVPWHLHGFLVSSW